MEALTAQLSNAMNILFLLGMMLASLIRLADGLKEQFFERCSLVMVVIGAFFMLLSAAHPSGTTFEVLCLHAGVFLWICSRFYSYFYNQFHTWISKLPASRKARTQR